MDGETTDIAKTADGAKRRKQQIRPALEVAIQEIVHRGATIAEAAQVAGLKRKSLAIALKKSHVSARLAAVKREWFGNETGKAWLTVARLTGDDVPPEVRLKAARTIIEAAGELGPNRRDDAPRAQQLVQIINHGGAIDLSGGLPNASGVFEAPPFLPARAAEGDGED